METTSAARSSSMSQSPMPTSDPSPPTGSASSIISSRSPTPTPDPSPPTGSGGTSLPCVTNDSLMASLMRITFTEREPRPFAWTKSRHTNDHMMCNFSPSSVENQSTSLSSTQHGAMRRHAAFRKDLGGGGPGKHDKAACMRSTYCSMMYWLHFSTPSTQFA